MTRTVHATEFEAAESFLKSFAEARSASGYLAAVWEVRNGQIKLALCTGHNFPVADRETAERQFHEVNVNELAVQSAASVTPPPLPASSQFGIVGDQRVDREHPIAPDPNYHNVDDSLDDSLRHKNNQNPGTDAELSE